MHQILENIDLDAEATAASLKFDEIESNDITAAVNALKAARNVGEQHALDTLYCWIALQSLQIGTNSTRLRPA